MRDWAAANPGQAWRVPDADVDAAVRVAIQQSGITGSAEPLAAVSMVLPRSSSTRA